VQPDCKLADAVAISFCGLKLLIGHVALFVMRQKVLKHCMQHRFNIEGDTGNSDFDLRHLAPLLLPPFLNAGAPTLKQFERDAGTHRQKHSQKDRDDLNPLLRLQF
jgi:hypothetical protein